MNLPGAAAIGEQLPIALTKKVTYWRKAFKSLPGLTILRIPANLIVNRMTDAADDWNAIIHAMWESFVSGDPPTMSMLTIKPTRGPGAGLSVGRADISTKTLDEMLKTINALSSSLVPISNYLSKLQNVSDYRLYLPSDARNVCDILTSQIPPPKSRRNNAMFLYDPQISLRCQNARVVVGEIPALSDVNLSCIR